MFEVFVNNELIAAPYEFNNLAPGVYDVEVLDSTGCNLNSSFEITPGVTLSATVALSTFVVTTMSSMPLTLSLRELIKTLSLP